LKETAREVFCYLGRLKLGDEFDQLLKLLPPDEQAPAGVIWSEIKKISEEDVRQRFIRLRQTEKKADE
jgi:hypothetical protein